MFYIVNFLILVLYTELFKKKKRWMNGLAFIHIASIIGLRANTVGTDTYKYWLKFAELQHNNLGGVVNFVEFNKFPGWWLLNKLLTTVLRFNTPDMYMVTSGLIISGLLIWMNSKYMNSNNHIYRLFYLLFLPQALNITRQFIGIFLVFFVYVNIKDKKYMRAILIELIAVGIHAVSALGIALFALPFVKRRKETLLKVGFTAALIGILVPRIMTAFGQMFGFYVNYSIGSEIATGKGVFIYLLEVLSIVCLERIQSKNRCDEEDFFEIEVICILTTILGLEFAKDVIVTRVILYMHFFVLYAFWLVSTHRNRYSQIYLVATYGLAAFSFIYRIAGNYGNILPWVTFVK